MAGGVVALRHLIPQQEARSVKGRVRPLMFGLAAFALVAVIIVVTACSKR